MIEVVAKASKGDSDSRMFFEYEGDFYLVGTTVLVGSNASASTITFGQIESDMEYKTNLRREPKRFPLRNKRIKGVN